MNAFYMCNLIAALWMIAATLSEKGRVPFSIICIAWTINGLIPHFK